MHRWARNRTRTFIYANRNTLNEWVRAKALPWNAVNRLCFLSADSHRRQQLCAHLHVAPQCTAAPCTMSTRGESVIYIVFFLRESCLNVDDKQTVCQKIYVQNCSLSVSCARVYVCVWTCSIDCYNFCTAFCTSPIESKLPNGTTSLRSHRTASRSFRRIAVITCD